MMASSIHDFTILKTIGTGSFGTCHKVLKKDTGEIFVWKVISYGKMKEDKKKLLVNEVNLLSGLNHPNIVKYYDRIIHKPTSTIYIVMEWCAGGDLSTLISQCKKIKVNLDEQFVWRVLYQLAQALHVCHVQISEGPVLHRDIKPANVFLDGNGNVKLGDFGLAYLLEDGKTSVLSGVVGTPFYLSPEAIQDGHYNEKSDIWSLGCLIYELCALHPPFDGTNLKTLIHSIQAGRFERIPQSYSANLQNMICYMLKVENSARPNVDNVLHHPEVIMHIVQGSLEAFESCCNLKTENESNVQEQNSSQPCNCSEVIAKMKDSLHLKLERLREWESVLKMRELEVANKEKVIIKREKQVALSECLVKEKISQAELYLQYCRNNRGSSANIPRSVSASRLKSKFPIYEEEEGETSFVNPTSAKLNPQKVEKPQVFSRSGSERRVHFGTLPTRKVQLPIEEVGSCGKKNCPSVNHLLIDGYSVKDTLTSFNITSFFHPKSDKSEKGKSKSKRSSVVVDGRSSSSSGQSNPYDQLLWDEERKRWLEQKRAVFLQSNKENVPDNNVQSNRINQIPLGRLNEARKGNILK